MMLILEDVIYGNWEVSGVLEELILSAPMQRLKAVHQGGAIFLVDPSQQHTRYEHSLGVCWLVRHFGGSIGEQIAALLHDVSHTAFSHVGDQVFGHTGEDYHEQIFEEVIGRSGIPLILAKHGYDQALQYFDRYTLLEQPLPDLCADRVDYTLRDLYHAGMISLADISHFVSELAVEGGRMVLTSEAAARWISMQFKRLNEEYFKKPEYLFANQRMAEMLKRAISDGLLKPVDLQLDDLAVIAKLRTFGFGEELDGITQLHGFEQFAVKGAAERIKRRELRPAVCP
ncbi:HD domain-containing protein [Mucilaginibacter roseus]|uniref:HD domain-containing protein n=1 Tax=Mucilaginibacter roseus TaxID=1528868 RepID=A0ABS8U0L2_9SPHI|nr:HD domain-containing protein [Mucilaginibacter roseus]MCD8739096.1 HD domain-containing protein [Mucilaginibacter roseus]